MLINVGISGKSLDNGAHIGHNWVTSRDPLKAKEEAVKILKDEYRQGWLLICDDACSPLWYFEKAAGDIPRQTQMHLARF